ncbi:hypothetical protein ACFLZB_03085 [Nanoarchaeota archaeon]
MKKIISILLLISVLMMSLTACSYEVETKPKLTEKAQAKEFALDVIQSFFDNDCEAFKSYLYEYVYSFEGEELIRVADFEDEVCGDFSNVVRGDHTFEDYLEAYEIRILEKDEYMEEFPDLATLDDLELSQRDYLFIGFELKDKNAEGFMWDDVLIFMVSNTPEDDWQITALG